MTLPPGAPSPFDPNNQNDDPGNYANDQQIASDVNQWLADQNQMSLDKTAIETALANLKSGSPDAIFAALMAFFMQIFPDVLNYQQDNMNSLADSQNISSDLRGFVNSIQNDFNEGASISAGQAADLNNNAQDLFNWTNYLDGTSTTPGPWSGAPPLDPTDGGQINQMISGIASEFGGTGGSATVLPTNWAGNIAPDMNTWFTPPAPGGTGPANPAPQIKAIQGDLQQANSSVSTMATTTQTSEQFYTNQYNQLTGIDNSMQQNSASEVSSFVTNQKTS